MSLSKLSLKGLVAVLCWSLCSFASPQSIRIPVAPRQGVNKYYNESLFKEISANWTLASYEDVKKKESLFSKVFSLSSSVSLKDYYNTIYTGVIKLGTPLQTFHVVFDTGSADLWVFSAKTTETMTAYNQYFYQDLSTTFNSTGSSFSITYGSGSASGTVGIESGSLGGLAFSTQKFGLGTTYSSDFQSADAPMSGVFGLSFQDISAMDVPTVVDTLKSEGKISARKFSFYLGSSSSSFFQLGDPDPTYYPNGLLTVDMPSQSNTMWVVPLASVKIDTTSSGLCSSRCYALVDTGTSYISFPSSYYNSIMAKIIANRSDCGMTSNSYVQCSNSNDYSNLPTLYFSIGGRSFPVTPQHYLTSSGYLGFQPYSGSTSGYDFLILGDTFLNIYYTVFDMDDQTISFALPANSSAAAFSPLYSPSSSSSLFSLAALTLLSVGISSLFL